jgi:DNA-binding transcriptional ArsR family regulator
MLDQTFASLADPTRRAIVERLTREREVNVGDLASTFATSLPAIIKHIHVLEHAGLVRRERHGRFVRCSLNPESMAEARAWLDRNLAFWTASFDALSVIVDGERA